MWTSSARSTTFIEVLLDSLNVKRLLQTQITSNTLHIQCVIYQSFEYFTQRVWASLLYFVFYKCEHAEYSGCSSEQLLWTLLFVFYIMWPCLLFCVAVCACSVKVLGKEYNLMSKYIFILWIVFFSLTWWPVGEVHQQGRSFDCLNVRNNLETS